MKPIDYILSNDIDVLKFLAGRYPLFHLSNVFFRDIQYGIQTLLERRNMSVGYVETEGIAKAFVGQLEKKKILKPIDQQSWVLHFEEMRKPPKKPAAPAAKAAPSAPAAPRPTVPKPAAQPAAVAAPVATAPEPPAAEAQPKPSAPPPSPAPKPAPAAAPSGKTIPPLGKRPLPPITSSKPAGGG